jgi:ParB family chromosome partitioning protein
MEAHMATPQKRLGRGLSSLISVPETPYSPPQESTHADSSVSPAALQVAIKQISPNPFQPRREIDPTEIQGLAASIRKSGVIQPLVVKPPVDQTYMLIAGERRWRAAELAGLETVPVTIRDANEQEMLEIALIENIFREDLNAVDRALAYRRYCDEFNLTAEEVGSRLGEDRTTIVNYMRLLDLPEEVRGMVADGRLGMGHARAILGLRNPELMARLARKAVEEGWSVRTVEKSVKEHQEAREKASQPPKTQEPAKRAQIRTLEESFRQSLGTKVDINESRRKGAGKITIHYYSLDDFDRIAEKLGVTPD